MAINRKAALPVQAGTLGNTALNNQANHNPFQPTTQSTSDSSADAQRERLLAAIQERGSISTYEARRPDLDIMHPSARIMELKKRGVPLQTVRVPELSPAGKVHNVARYVMAVEERPDHQDDQEKEDDFYCPACEAMMPHAEECPYCGGLLLRRDEWQEVLT